MIRKLLLSLLCGMAIPACAANELSDTTHVFKLGEVNVFGSKYQFKDNTVNSTFIKNADLFRASEALSWVPGVTITEASGRGEAGFMLRGMSSDLIPIYIDGVPMTAAYDGTIDLYRIGVGSVSKIEVSKAASSLLLGGNTFGPTVNLISRKPIKPLEIHFDGNTLWRSNLNIGGRWGKWYAQADFGYSYQPDYKIPDASLYRVTDKSGAVSDNPYLDGKTRLHTHTHDFNMNVKAGYTPNATDEYVVGYSMIRSSKDIPPTLGLGMTRFWRYTDWNKDELYFHSTTNLSNAVKLNSRLWYDKFDNTLDAYDDFTYSTQTKKSSWESIYNDYTLGAHVGLDWATCALNDLRFGVNYKNDVHRSHNLGEPEAKMSEGMYSFVVEDEYRFDPQWSATGSIGYFGHKGYKIENYTNKQIENLPTSNDHQVNGLAALDYHPNDNHHVRLTAARTSRFARLKDRYSYKLGKQIPNPDLGTEKSWNMDLSYEGKAGAFNWSASAYYLWIDDIMTSVAGVDASDPTITQMQNKGRADYRGFELGAGYDTRYLTLKANYAYIDQDYKDHDNFHFLYTPKSRFTLFAEVRPIWELRLQYRLQAQGRSYAQNDGSAYVAGFGVQDMSLARKFWKVDVKVGVLNLANKTYEYTAGYPQRGRTWYGSLSFDL